MLGAHQLIETVYQLVTRTDAETMRFLNDWSSSPSTPTRTAWSWSRAGTCANPEPTRRSSGGLPRLYQKYIGHDNNRDFYMSTQPESTNMNRVMYTEWFPQIMYNHHQTGPAGTVMFAPPFRDPFNYNFDPLIPAQLDLVAAAMHSRFAAEGKPGVTSRTRRELLDVVERRPADDGLLPQHDRPAHRDDRQPDADEHPVHPVEAAAGSNLHFPIAPQAWHFRQSIDYSVTANYAVLDIASRNKENFLYNIYQMGKNSIERGNRDSWTATPRRVIAATAAVSGGGRGGGRARCRRAATSRTRRPDAAVAAAAARRRTSSSLLRDPTTRDPRGYILPADQPDFPTATKFVNALLKTGVTVHRATAAFTVGGKNYPAGSYVVKAAQAFRPHVLDMFEPQDHPDDIPYPGGPPTPPYDNAGWTLAYQMGVKFDRMLDGFDGPFEKLSAMQKPAPGKVTTAAAAGYTFSHAVNDAFIAVNRLLAAGEDVYWVTARFAAGRVLRRGQAVDDGRGREAGGRARRLASKASRQSRRRRDQAAQVRIALADQYGGSMPSGWTRWLLEQFEFPFEVVFPQALDAGNLSSKYDVIIFPVGPSRLPDVAAAAAAARQPSAAAAARRRRPVAAAGGAWRGNIPAEYQAQLGAYTAAQTCPQLKKFLEDGGTILAVGRSSTNLAELLDLPVGNHLVERTPGRDVAAAAAEKFYVPGSVLRVAVDTTRAARARASPSRSTCSSTTARCSELGPDAGAEGRAAGGLVRQRRRRCAAAGPRARAISRAASRSSRRRSARASCTCSVRRSPSARSRTARSSSCSTGSIWARRTRRAGREKGTPDGSRRLRSAGFRPLTVPGPSLDDRRARRLLLLSSRRATDFRHSPTLSLLGAAGLGSTTTMPMLEAARPITASPAPPLAATVAAIPP